MQPTPASQKFISTAQQAVADGRVTPGKKVPAVYCVGPLNRMKSQSSDGTCLNWLDSQPPRSVVFLCFGSLGAFSEPQLREIAIGLERSGQRFLWAVRSPPTLVPELTPGGGRSAPPETDLQALLPEGFADRTAERGLVVKSWAPQAEVLRHVAIGGFVTHGGWNSVLESVGSGVPMVVWPLYAEQRLNKIVVVEMGLAAEMRGYEKGAVEAGEVEERVRGLLEAQWGKDLTARIKLSKLASEEAVAKQGSSVVAIDELVANIKLQEL